MIRYRAAWVLPIERPPIRDGWVTIDGGRIAAVGTGAGEASVREVDLGEAALMPGLVNAHTHLELSYLHGEIPSAPTFTSWVREVMAARRRRSDPNAPEIVAAVHRAIDQSVAFGTALVGDISNTLVTFAPLAESRLAALVFYELIRFNPGDPDGLVEEAQRMLAILAASDRVRTSLAAHAPYSVSLRLFRAIRAAIDREPSARCSVHLAESPEEVEFLRTGGGEWRRVLEDFGVWDPAWTPPGVGPVEYLDEAGFLDARVLVVHGVQASAADLARLAARGSTLVTCPRSNAFTGVGAPPVEAFYASGVPVAIGTDSLASAPDLNVFEEIAALHAIAPSVPPSALLDSATRQGANALGFDEDFGTIEPRKRAPLLAVTIPSGVGDVEQYLVSGIQPEQLRWIE